MEHSVTDIPDEELLRRAVANVRSGYKRKQMKRVRWSVVADVFGLGSTYSYQLCRRFGLDPDKEV